MAPSTRARRRRDAASTLHPSIEAASDCMPPLSNSKNPNDDRESNTAGHEPDKTEDPQRQGLETPGPQTRSLVSGVEMLVPRTYDPDTYDPDGRMPWTPEPEPYDPETYAAWGRKHFGEEWYEQRKTMLQERNIYRENDPVYRERQRALRVMEHKIEGRPFRPYTRFFGNNFDDEGWKRLWARLSKDLPSVEQGNNPASPPPNDSDSDLSGYNTYPPTPESREETPPPDDTWERLEYNRRRFCWDEERYQFEKIFLKEGLIDGARRKREDEGGDKRREEELEEIRKVRYLPGTLIKSGEYDRRMRHFNLRAEGWTQEQIDAEDRAASARWREAEERRKRYPPTPIPGFGPVTQEEMEARLHAWDAMGLSKERQAELVRKFGLPNVRPSSTDEGAESEVVSQPRASPARPAKGTSRKTRSGRITKNAPQRQSDSRRGTRSRQSAPTSAEALPPDQGRGPSKPNALEELSDNTRTAPQRRRRQRKTYEKERASRRLAGQVPEFGMLPERGETRPVYKASLRQPSNICKTSSSGPRSGRLSKKPTVAKGAKPQGISKSKQDGAGHLKRSMKQLRA
ncbi:hypothetical protein F5883DRAFT_442354 [Diaporthe sp. PMI_573]|nr:hypothetical protein F5883DRAFT_442354 [Diaporthaceae sp. PMI_573]